jgi:hypothetical protein
VFPDRFVDELPRVLADAPPLPGEEARYAQVLAVLDAAQPPQRVQLAGPQVLTHAEMVRLATRGRPLVPVPTPIARTGLRLAESALPRGLPLTWDEAELLEVTTVTSDGDGDPRALGVQPRAMAEALAA